MITEEWLLLLSKDMSMGLRVICGICVLSPFLATSVAAQIDERPNFSKTCYLESNSGKLLLNDSLLHLFRAYLSDPTLSFSGPISKSYTSSGTSTDETDFTHLLMNLHELSLKRVAYDPISSMKAMPPRRTITYRELILYFTEDRDSDGSQEIPLQMLIQLLTYSKARHQATKQQPTLLNEIMQSLMSKWDAWFNRCEFRSTAYHGEQRFLNIISYKNLNVKGTPSTVTNLEENEDIENIEGTFLEHDGDHYVLHKLASGKYASYRIDLNGDFSKELGGRKDALAELRTLGMARVAQYMNDQWKLMDMESPPSGSPSLKVIWNTNQKKKSARDHMNDYKDRYGVRPRYWLGFLDSLQEGYYIQQIVDQSGEIPFPWLLTFAIGEGWDLSRPPIHGFNDLGLDTFDTEIVQLKSRNYIAVDFCDYLRISEKNEFGQTVQSALFFDTKFALQAFAATIDHRKHQFLEYATEQGKDISAYNDDQLFFFTYLFFNAGKDRAIQIISDKDRIAYRFFEPGAPIQWEGNEKNDNRDAIFNSILRLSTLRWLEFLGLW